MTHAPTNSGSKSQPGHALIEAMTPNGKRRLNGFSARRQIAHCLRQLQWDAAALRRAWQEPGENFGPFSSLPGRLRDALSDAADFHMHESHFATARIPRLLGQGPVVHLGSLLVHWGWIVHRNIARHPGRAVIGIGRGLIKTGRLSAKAYLKVFRFTPLYRGPFLHFLWKRIGLNPWDLIQDYICGIPMSSAIHPVFMKRNGAAVGAAFVGIDLLPSRGKLYFMEGNFNAGHYMERARLNPAGDTVCRHLLDWAKSRGYPAMHFYPSNLKTQFPEDLERSWQEMARRAGIAIKIIDDPYFGSPQARIRGLQRELERCRVLVNGRYISGPITTLIAGKGVLEDAFLNHNASAAEEKRIWFPGKVHSDTDLPDPDLNPALPNLIIKDVRRDRGAGIYLFKTRTLPLQARTPNHVSYEFIPPDYHEESIDGKLKRFVYLFRAYLLIAPDGAHYMGARKDVSPIPVADTLPFGRVYDKARFATNLHLGAYSLPHSDAEDDACRAATLAIGGVIHRFLQEKYEAVG